MRREREGIGGRKGERRARVGKKKARRFKGGERSKVIQGVMWRVRRELRRRQKRKKKVSGMIGIRSITEIKARTLNQCRHTPNSSIQKGLTT